MRTTLRGFSEELIGPEHGADPLDGLLWQGSMPGEEAAEATKEELDMERLATALGRLLGWMAGQNKGQDLRDYDRHVGRRAIALIWVVNPALFEGSPSLAHLAKGLGITRAALSGHSAAFSRAFGLRNRSQVAHGWAAEPAVEAAREEE
jgi:hypothetical protein